MSTQTRSRIVRLGAILAICLFLLVVGCNPTGQIIARVEFHVGQNLYQMEGTMGFFLLIDHFLGFERASDPLAISIRIPEIVRSGDVFTQHSRHFDVVFADHTGQNHRTHTDHNFTLTVTRWDGPGGYAQGTFEGTLVKDGTWDEVEITQGSFWAFIHN